MVNFLLRKCTNCDSLQNAICTVDGVLAQYGKNSWQNISFLTSKEVPYYRIRQLLYYKEILFHLQWNQDFYCGYSLEQIVSRIKALSGGELRIARRMKIGNPITTTTTTTSTTSTSTTSTTSTSTTSTTTSTTSSTTTTTTTLAGDFLIDSNGDFLIDSNGDFLLYQ